MLEYGLVYWVHVTRAPSQALNVLVTIPATEPNFRIMSQNYGEAFSLAAEDRHRKRSRKMMCGGGPLAVPRPLDQQAITLG